MGHMVRAGTSGKKRDTLKGQATMQLFTHLQHELERFAPAIYNGLLTEVSTSKERCFPLITFIDTPGLVDGSFQYLFPVEDAILAVAKHTDVRQRDSTHVPCPLGLIRVRSTPTAAAHLHFLRSDRPGVV